MFRRTLGGEYRWCHQWWQHDEAISRLTALWHAWEVLRLQPGTGIGTWYRDHLDHQLPILMGARGPFYQCSETATANPARPPPCPCPANGRTRRVPAEYGALPGRYSAAPGLRPGPESFRWHAADRHPAGLDPGAHPGHLHPGHGQDAGIQTTRNRGRRSG